MPELPEVETVKRGLEASLKGAVIADVELRRKDLRFPLPLDFAKRLKNARITSITRRAKYLIFTLDNGESILAHLGMSGRFSVLPARPKKFETHDHVVISLSDGRVLVYNDARRFGIMDVAKTSDIMQHELLYHLGPEPLSADFSSAYLKEKLLKRKGPIKPVLMNQELVVGVGNIYASEALYNAKIHPETPSHQAAAKSALLIKCIREVLESAIKSGGSSLRDFVHVSGDTGYFQHHFNVYDRDGEPCFSCKKPLKTMRQAGRSTFFCAHCQR